MYIGNDLQVAESGNKIIDDISSSFNGSTTSFALTVGGYAPVPFPINTQQIYISVNGVLQEPDPSGSAGFRLSGSNIVFSSAPANGHAFFGVILSGADYVTVGTEFPAGSATAPSITFGTDNDTGMYSVTAGTMGFTSNGVQTFTLDGDGFRFNDGKKLICGTGSDLNIYHDGTNSLVENTNTGGYLGIRGDTVYIQDHTNDHAYITCVRDGAVGLRYDNTERFTTTNTGTNTVGIHVDDGATHDGDVTFTGASANVLWDKSADDLIFTDNSKAVFGTSSDGLEIFHNGSNSIINEQGTGTLQFQTGGSSKVTINNSGRLLVGQTTSYEVYANSLFQVSATGGEAAISVTRWSNNSSSPYLNFGKSRGGIGSYTVVQDDDRLGQINFCGADGTDLVSPAAGIAAYVDGTPGGNDMPGRLVFFTASDGGVAETERMRINAAGDVMVGASGNSNSSLDRAICIGSSSYARPGLVIRGNSTNKGDISFCDNSGTESDDGVSEGLLRYDHDGDYMCFHTQDSEKLRITSSGYVGIGTTSPDKTGIQNNVSVLQIDSGDGAELILGNSVSANVSVNHVGAIAFKNIDNSTGNAPHFAGIRSNCVDTSGNMNLKFYGGSTEFEADTPHMVIHETGVVTLGTATKNASDRLTVLDPGSAFMSIRSDSHSDGNSQVLDFGVGVSNRASGNLTASIEADIHSTSGGTLKSDLLFYTNSGDNISEKLRIKDTGYVGIGVNPVNLLHLYHATTNTLLRIQSGDATAGMEFFDNSTNDGDQAIIGCKGDDFFIETGGLEQFRVSEEGNLKWKAHSSSNHVWTRKAFGDVSLSAGATQDIRLSEGFTNNTIIRVEYAFTWNDGNGGAWGTGIAWKHHDANWDSRFLGEEVASPAESVAFVMNGNNLDLRLTMSSGSGMNGRFMVSVDHSSPNQPHNF